MRTWGRNSEGQWIEVSTTASGDNTYVWITTLCQNLLLNLGESPFYSQNGIPARQSVIQQLFPDFYVSLTQQRFAPYFASLIVTKLATSDPEYQINIVTNQGVILNETIVK